MCPGGGDASPTLNTEGGRVDPFFFPFVPPPPPPPPFALSSASGELAFRFDPRASPFPPLFFPSRLFIHRMRSATSRTPFAGSVAAILMYLHRLAYASAPYVSIPRSSTACSSLDHCASYRFVPVVPACEPDLTASAAAASSILVPTRLFPLFPLVPHPPRQAREDWKILRALSECVGAPPPLFTPCRRLRYSRYFCRWLATFSRVKPWTPMRSRMRLGTALSMPSWLTAVTNCRCSSALQTTRGFFSALLPSSISSPPLSSLFSSLPLTSLFSSSPLTSSHPPSASTANLRDLGNGGLSQVPDSSVLLTLAPSAPMPPAVPPITPAPLTSAPGVDASAPRSTMELEPLRRATTTRWLPHPLSSGDERFLLSV